MSNRVVMFDVDGVLADFVEGFTSIGNKKFGTPTHGSLEQRTWDHFPGLTTDHTRRIWDHIKQDAEFWRNLDPLVSTNTFRRIDYLDTRDVDVYFCTSRVGVDPKWQTEIWLRSWGLTDPTVIVSEYKGEVARCINATHAIEDKAGNAVCIQHMSKAQSYILDRPYNRFDHKVVGTRVTRVYSVEEFLHIIEST